MTLSGKAPILKYPPALFILSFLFICSSLIGQVRVVESGDLTYRQPADWTYIQFEGWMVEQARLKALADAFGTHVASEFVAVNGEGMQLSSSQVKGEWVQTVSKEITPLCQEGEGGWYKINVKGKARSLPDRTAVLEFEVTQDIQGDRHIQHISHDQRLRALFQSPVDGYVLFFYQEGDRVYELSSDGSLDAEKVQGQVAYSLFLKPSERESVNLGEWSLGWLDRYSWSFRLTNHGTENENGTVIAVFDRSTFSPPVTRISAGQDEKTALRELSFKQFESWKAELQRRRDSFQVVKRPIILLPKSSR